MCLETVLIAFAFSLLSTITHKLIYQQGLKIGNDIHKFSGIVPEAQSSPFEIYCQQKSSSIPKLDLLGRVTHKIQVRRGLDSSSMERIKNRTEEAERERNSRKYIPPHLKSNGVELSSWKSLLHRGVLHRSTHVKIPLILEAIYPYCPVVKDLVSDHYRLPLF
jgi:hypothetical protein